MRKMLLGCVAAALAMPAAATITTVAGHFLATNWSVLLGEPAPPVDPLFLDFSISFDASQSYAGDTDALSVFATNIPYDLRFSYNPITSLIVIATDGNAGGCTLSAASFCALLFDGNDGVPFFVAQAPSDGGAWVAGAILDNRQVGPGIGVPEPAGWALLIAGFGLTGAVLRARRQAAVA